MPPMEGDFAGAQLGEPHTDDEPRGNGELHNRDTQGDGEPRRRRRGRRGGRRNRRDAEGPDGSPGAGEPRDQAFAPEMADAPYAAGSETTTSEPFVAAQPIAPPPPAPPAPTPATPVAEAPPRRRSTVREAAPMSRGDIVSSPPPSRPVEPAPAPVVSDASEDDDANKPRKTGWWAKRLLGKS
jgi:ribonuclease E